MKFKIRTVSESRKTPVDPLTVEDIQKAETEIMRLVQHAYEVFKEEIVMLKSKEQREELKDRNSTTCRNKEMKKVSCLYRQDSFLDENNILRVGGRIRRANLAPINRKASHHFTS
jgi:HD-GYP domain-containing protein (c-di-GMP phosphodiesterase class II)